MTSETSSASPVFGTDRSFNIAVDGPCGKVVVGGVDVSNGIRGFWMYAGVGHAPRLELDIVVDRGAVAGDRADVVMAPGTEELLLRAGWRPPGDPGPLGAAVDRFLASLRRIADSARDSVAATAPEAHDLLAARAQRADALELAASMAEQDLSLTLPNPASEESR